MIKLVVGLGNPGVQYEKTRHNAGFIILDRLVSSLGLRWSANSQFEARAVDFASGFGRVVLLKPMAFMNKSGLPVVKMMRYYKFTPGELLVIHDELDLPEGVVKMKRDGGHAGHNGLRDIIAHIDSRDFYRLRVGIGRPSAGSNVADYVLSNPSKAVLESFDSVADQLLGDLDLILQGDVARSNGALSAS